MAVPSYWRRAAIRVARIRRAHMDAVQIIVSEGAVSAAGQGAVALATVKWFGGKVFGPSADALGENLRAYLATRVSTVFAKAGEIAQERQLEPGPIRPGLLSRMIVDCSFSDDSDDITKWWANLFVDASLSSSNEHAVFSDMIALFGPAEAKCLREFVESFPHASEPSFGRAPAWMDVLESKFEAAVKAWLGAGEWADRHDEIVGNFRYGDPSWPMRPTEWLLYRRVESEEELVPAYGHSQWYTQNLLAIDILKRAGVFASLDASMPVWGGNIWVRGLGLTTLGYEFYRACEGRTH